MTMSIQRTPEWMLPRTFRLNVIIPWMAIILLVWVAGRVSNRLHVSKMPTRPAVTFARIGQEGRLGNQLFQIASTIGVAEANAYSWGFYKNVESCAAGRLFEIHGDLDQHRPVSLHQEESQLYYDVVLPEKRKHQVVSLSGYFQDYRYFHKSLDALNKYLHFPERRANLVRKKVPEVTSPFSVALHVRRGDYVKLNELYHVLDVNYYLRALSLVESRIDNVIIVSDDISWCKEMLVPRIPYRTVFSPFKDELSDFLLLHLSRCIIIANSSFSWWAAFLKYVRSPLKLKDLSICIFAPTVWYNISGGFAYMNRDSFLPPDWTRVAV